MLQKGHSVDGCDLTSTLCKNNLRKSDLMLYGCILCVAPLMDMCVLCVTCL